MRMAAKAVNLERRTWQWNEQGGACALRITPECKARGFFMRDTSAPGPDRATWEHVGGLRQFGAWPKVRALSESEGAMSNLSKAADYSAMSKAAERYTGDCLSISYDANTGEVRVLPMMGADRGLFGRHIAEAVKRRQHDLITECLAEAKREAIDQAESVQRAADAALKRLKGEVAVGELPA